MGLTAWVARYALPNARPTPACDWELPEAPPAEAPGERLHALLDEAREVPPSPRPAEPEPPRAARPPRPGMARALLGEAPVEEAAAAPKAAEAEASPPREALRFAFQVACLEGRWLLILAGERAPGPVELKLLANLLRAAGIAAPLPVFQSFRWPPRLDARAAAAVRPGAGAGRGARPGRRALPAARAARLAGPGPGRAGRERRGQAGAAGAAAELGRGVARRGRGGAE